MPFCVVWWNLMLPCSILTGHQLSLRPVYPAHYSLVIHLLYEIKCHGITVLVFKSPLFYLIMVSKLKRGDAGNSDMSKRSYKVLPLSEMVKVIYLIRKENNHTLKWLSESESHSVKSTLCNPMDNTVHGILQARILEWTGENFPSPGDLPSPKTKPRSPTLQVDSLPAESQGEVAKIYSKNKFSNHEVVKKENKFLLVLLSHFKLKSYVHSAW